MYYTIDKPSLHARIEEEVSKVADEAYGDNGASLYDSIVLTSKDEGTVDRFIDDAVNALVRRTFDICKFYTATDSSTGQATDQLYFFVPDFDETMEDAVKEEITKYIVLYAANSIFIERRASSVTEYTGRAQAAVDKAVHLLKSRKSPIDIW